MVISSQKRDEIRGLRESVSVLVLRHIILRRLRGQDVQQPPVKEILRGMTRRQSIPDGIHRPAGGNGKGPSEAACQK